MLNGDYGNDISDEAITRLAELESPVRHYIEEKVWSYLETRCKLLLQSYKTTVQVKKNLRGEICVISIFSYITVNISSVMLQ